MKLQCTPHMDKNERFLSTMKGILSFSTNMSNTEIEQGGAEFADVSKDDVSFTVPDPCGGRRSHVRIFHAG